MHMAHTGKFIAHGDAAYRNGWYHRFILYLCEPTFGGWMDGWMGGWVFESGWVVWATFIQVILCSFFPPFFCCFSSPVRPFWEKVDLLSPCQQVCTLHTSFHCMYRFFFAVLCSFHLPVCIFCPPPTLAGDPLSPVTTQASIFKGSLQSPFVASFTYFLGIYLILSVPSPEHQLQRGHGGGCAGAASWCSPIEARTSRTGPTVPCI